MSSPLKVVIMNMPCNTGVKCNSIQSGVTISGQMCQFQVIACQVSDSMSIIKCHISGVKYKVSSDNTSSTGVRYQVSKIRCLVITCNVPMSDIKYQVYTYQGQVINMLVRVTISYIR